MPRKPAFLCLCAAALAVSVASLARAETVTWTGSISDAKCGPKMTGYCAKACVSAGEKPVFVTVEKQVVPITNPETTKGHEGERVVVQGELAGGKMTIKSIQAAKDKQ